MTLASSWRLVPGQHLLHRCWDGECVLYNDLTGDTHLVDDCALALLELLRAAPMPAAGLAAALGVDAPADADPAGVDGGSLPPDAAFDAMLAELAALHLIEKAPC